MDDAVERLLRAGRRHRAARRRSDVSHRRPRARDLGAASRDRRRRHHRRRAGPGVDHPALVADLGLVAVPREVEALRPASMTRLRLPDELTGDTRLDVIGRSHEYHDRVFARGIVVDVLGVQMRVACAEDIIILKALADRPQDRADVADIIAAQGAALDRELIRRECAALEISPPALA